MLCGDLTLTDDRTLYVGTDHALYRARPGGDGRWRAEGLALAGLGGVRGLLIDPEDRRHWLACTSACGVMVTADDGITWRESNHGITRPEGWCLARHPRTGELWYGAGPASVFRSQDGGETWTACEAIDSLPDRGWDSPHPPYTSRVRHIAIGPDRVVLAAVEEGWLLRSEDGGDSWVNVRDGLDRDCHAVTFLARDGRVALATTGQGIFRSEDAGRTFALSAGGLRHRYVVAAVQHPDRPDVLFTAAADVDPVAAAQRPEGADGAFYRSDDAGMTWSRLTGGLPRVLRPAPTCVAGDPGHPDSFYVGTTDGSVWLSEDGGASFDIAVEGIQGWVRHLLVVRR
jgi:BNR/Asp-box repeat